MDLWVVAAAAGAGYLAKFWQNISQCREGSSGSPTGSSIPDNSKASTSIQQTCETRNGNHSEQVFVETSQRDGSVPQNVSSISSLNHVKQGDSIFPPESRKHEKFQNRGGCMVDSDVGDMPEYPPWEMRDSHGSTRSKNCLRSKCLPLQFVRPRSSLDSCLMAQMYREDGEIEDYLRSPLASPCTPIVRSFLVTDGRRIISRSSGTYRNGLHKEVHPKADDKVVGIPPLPKSKKADYPKLKLNQHKSRKGRSCYTGTSVQFDSQGSASGQVFFSFGISIGIIFTMMANKLEVEKLKESLNQTKNLVQDLQEELEMKDSLTVKELVNDDDSQDTHENWCGNKRLNMFSWQVDRTAFIKCDDGESISLKEAKSISNIEAELEAELERLDQSIGGSAMQERLTDDIEFNADFDDDTVAELVHGELNADIVGRRSSSEPSPDRDSSSPSTPLSAKQGVSPHELSLRLHEVIQSRLEARIKELEAELAKSQRHIQHLESERIISWRDISNSESSSTLGSPITPETYSPMAALVINLSGDALDAYNEAYEGLSKLKGPQNGPYQMQMKNQHNLLLTNQNGFRDCKKTLATITAEKPLANGVERKTSNEVSPIGYEDDNNDDDLLLIKQIVEKAKQGSPAVLRAQRALVCLNKDDDQSQ